MAMGEDRDLSDFIEDLSPGRRAQSPDDGLAQLVATLREHPNPDVREAAAYGLWEYALSNERTTRGGQFAGHPEQRGLEAKGLVFQDEHECQLDHVGEIQQAGPRLPGPRSIQVEPVNAEANRGPGIC
jgi:hypothetical protein